MSDTKTTTGPGLGVLLLKLGPKMFAVALKMKVALLTIFKSLVSFKTVGIAASVAMYAYLFTWQMGVALVAFIGIHEYGHIWAMHRCGARTRGMFFIPGFGAVAIAEDRFGNARNEAYIALMGPVWGIVGFVLPILIAYVMTRNPMWAAIASFTTFINLVNLFPVNPLDGGRVMKALVYSKRPARSLLISVLFTVIGFVIAAFGHLGLLGYMAVIGLFELVIEFNILDRLPNLKRTVYRLVAISLVLLAFNVLADGNLLFWIGSVLLLAAAVGLWFDWRECTKSRSWLDYPYVVLKELVHGVKEVVGLRPNHIQPIKDYDWMTGVQKWGYGTFYLGLIALHVVLIISLANLPEAAIGQSLLH